MLTATTDVLLRSASNRRALVLLATTGVLLCCSWYSVAMAQTGDGGSAPQLRVRIFLEAPLGTAAAAPLAVRVVTDGPVLQLVNRGVEVTTQVQLVIYARNSATELRMTISVDDAEVATVPSSPIAIADAGGMMRRTAQFELTAKRIGEATVTVAVTDGASMATAALSVIVEAPIAVIEPQADTELQLLSRGPEAMTRVQAVINAVDSATELRMTISTDGSGAEVVAIPNVPIVIAAAGNATRRTAQFALTAKKAGKATVRIAVTDGTNTATVVLRVVVVDPLEILSPLDGTQIALVRGDGSLAAIQVEFVIAQPNVGIPVVLNLQLDEDTMSPVFIPTTSLTLIASDDGIARTQFTLAAAEAGNTSLTIIASDSLRRRAVVSVRVSVTRLDELCESCLVPDMVTVPSGTYTRGRSGFPFNATPLNQVSISYPLAVGKYELTRGQFKAFVAATGYDAGSGWKNSIFTQTDAHPVVGVSWYDAKAYLDWLSEETGEEWRLLSEVEWEYAARAGTTTDYSFGNTIDTTQARFDSNTGTVAVGSYATNAFGLYDVHGNVSEWVEDCWHDDYTNAPTDGSAWLSECDENARVHRGGNWLSFLHWLLRSSGRDRSSADNRSAVTITSIGFVAIYLNGFRVARTIE